MALWEGLMLQGDDGDDETDLHVLLVGQISSG